MASGRGRVCASQHFRDKQAEPGGGKGLKREERERSARVKRTPNVGELFELTDWHSPAMPLKWLLVDYKPDWQVCVLSSGKFLLARLILHPGKPP